MKFIKKIIAILLVLAVSLPYAWALEVVASSATQRELWEIEDELRELEDYIDAGHTLLLNLRQDLQELRDEMLWLDTQIADVVRSIDETEQAIDALSISIAHVLVQRAEAAVARDEAQVSRAAGEEILAARVRAMHESGQVNILDVLFNAESITDFLVRLEDLRRVIQFNRELIERLEGYEKVIQAYSEELFLKDARLQDLRIEEERQYEILLLQLDDLHRQMDEKSGFLVELEEDEEMFALLLELLEIEHYALVERGLEVQAQFDREMAAAAFNHAARQANMGRAPSLATPWTQAAFVQPRVHTAPAVASDGIPDILVALANINAGPHAERARATQMAQDAARVAAGPVTLDPNWRELFNRPAERRVNPPAEGRFAWPVPSHPYVEQGAVGTHIAIDIFGAVGAPIVAADRGEVVFSDWTIGFGNLVILDHGDGYRTLYVHNKANHVQVGQVVERGQHIADVGASGSTTVDHLHFEVRRNNVAVDPMQFFE